jgi:hypothetical protein
LSVVQRVIILNKPFKIRGFTIWQWCVLTGALALGFFIWSKIIPHDWKIPLPQGYMPTGLFLGIIIVCGALVVVSASQMKPLIWWKNRILYTLGFAPRLYLPVREEGQPYPDATIKEAVKREDQPYVAVENFEPQETDSDI